jgi:DNA repair protein RadC
MGITVKKNPHEGHRQRLRERFIKTGLDGFHDYEFIELLLTYAIPQRDVKPIAKELLRRFGGIKGIFDASREDLTSVTGIGERTAILIKLLKEGSTLYLKTRVKHKEVLSSLQDVLNFCHHALSGSKNEKFMVLYLTTKNELIEAEVLEEGTINQTAVYPRKVIEGALRHNASALIFVHNHPSGDPTPSHIDRQLTDALEKAALTIDISVHDHIIIGKNTHFSGREHGWLAGNQPASSTRVADRRTT